MLDSVFGDDSFADPLTTLATAPSTEHQRAADSLAVRVIDRANAAGIAISDEIRREAIAAVRRVTATTANPHLRLRFFLQAFRGILRRYEPVLARTITDAQLAAWMHGGQAASDVMAVGVGHIGSVSQVDGVSEVGSLPSPPAYAHAEPPTMFPVERSPSISATQPPVSRPQPVPTLAPPSPPPRPPAEPPDWLQHTFAGDRPRPIVRYPIIDEAAADMASRRVLLPEEFHEARGEARLQAFTISRVASLDTLEKVQEALFDAITDGDTLDHFEDKVGDALGASGLSPARIEQVFRDNINHSYARGQKAVVEHPLVKSVAMFVWRSEINDSRLTPLCYALSHSGLQGTAIFCTDDPLWRKIAPPSHHGCRCGAIYLDVKRAAAKGLLVAQKWLETGVRPDESELFVAPPDLSEVPVRDRLQFDSWVSPWAA